MQSLWFEKWLPMVGVTACLICVGTMLLLMEHSIWNIAIASICGAVAIWLPETWYSIVMLHLGEQATKEDMGE